MLWNRVSDFVPETLCRIDRPSSAMDHPGSSLDDDPRRQAGLAAAAARARAKRKRNRTPHQKCSETWHQRAKSNQRDFSCLQSFRFPAESLRMCLAELLLLKSFSVAPRRLTRRPSTSGVNTELLCCGGATYADAARLPRHESSVTIAPGRRRRDFPVGREVEYSSRGPGPDPSTTIRPRLFSSAA